jgi:hypothetical protein
MPHLNGKPAGACQTSNVVPAELQTTLITAVERISAAEQAVADTEKAAKAANKAAAVATEAAYAADNAADEAKQKCELRETELGHLLIKVRELHTSEKTFLEYVDKHVGLKKSRAHEYMKIARDEVTSEDNKATTLERVKKHRAAKKAAKAAAEAAARAAPKLTLVPPSVTPKSVTDEVEPDTSDGVAPLKAKFAEMDNADAAEVPTAAPAEPVDADEAGDKLVSAGNLKTFLYQARYYLPTFNATDLATARAFVAGDEWRAEAPVQEVAVS